MLKIRPILRCLAILLSGLTVANSAGVFAPPAEGPVAFRRDRIPLEVEAMANLSQQVETLARSMDTKTAPERRGAAQMLALALALDPGNAKARDLISDFEKGRHRKDAQNSRLETSRAGIWLSIAWLQIPDTGADAHALANCLRDVISIADPTNPKSAAILAEGEKGAWSGWIPELYDYEAKPLAENDKSKKVVPQTPAPSPILLEKAQVSVPLWKRVGKDDWEMAACPLQMSASQARPGSEGEALFSIVIGSRPDLGALDQLADSLKSLLKSQHDPLPQGVRIQITSKEFEDSIRSRKRQSISAAAAVLASSAISGREPNAIIIGQIDGTGVFKPSTGFWDQLQSLGKGSGQRLILPKEADTYLLSMLSLEKPEFFIQYEVVLASNFKELLELSAKAPSEPFASASAKFREIRERADQQKVRLYIGNSFVKQRLSAVLQDYPAHVSAKMLLIQASGNRPVTIPRVVLASEIRRTITPVAKFLKLSDLDGISAARTLLSETYETCRTRIDELERYAEKNDRNLVDRARDLANTVRTLERAPRSRGDILAMMATAQSTNATLNELYTKLLDDIALATGESIAVPPQR